ncbi:MAG: hypothetical protein PHV42_02380 [Candidatus Pacebacteria bacterium]|nr:hypothetical protein [Candidatus Paceibacterota bacterium]
MTLEDPKNLKDIPQALFHNMDESIDEGMKIMPDNRPIQMKWFYWIPVGLLVLAFPTLVVLSILGVALSTPIFLALLLPVALFTGAMAARARRQLYKNLGDGITRQLEKK